MSDKNETVPELTVEQQRIFSNCLKNGLMKELEKRGVLNNAQMRQIKSKG